MNNNREIPSSWVGLRPNNKFVRQTFSTQFRQYLESLEKWFVVQESFRHALGHRIPLYIPPYIVPEDNIEEYNRIENMQFDERRNGNIEKFESLEGTKMQYVYFEPIMKHSFFDDMKPINFHPQLLADFNTICEISDRFILELNY